MHRGERERGARQRRVIGLPSWSFVAVLVLGALIAAIVSATVPREAIAPSSAPAPGPRSSDAAAFAGPDVAPEPAVAARPGAERTPREASAEDAEREREPAPRPEPHVLVRVPTDLRLTARPGAGRVVGVVPSGSRFYDIPTVAWVQEVDRSGRFGRLAVPYTPGSRSGWLRLTELPTHTTWVEVQVDLSERIVRVYRRDRLVLRSRVAIGAPASPTPRGRYFVTDRIPFGPGHSLGRFAFGLSGIQPRLPAGWSGGDQLAIHGTNDPGSIGQAASAGCIRVPAGALERLKPLLQLGTPVTISR